MKRADSPWRSKPTASRRGLHRYAFTLIEMLITISIIALLIGVTLPALHAARGSARSAVCLSNVRQNAIALLYYSHDHDGRFVSTVQDIPGERVWWFGSEPMPTGPTPRPIDPTRSPLAPYFDGNLWECLACPDFPIDDARYFAKFTRRSAHYGYNGGLCWPTPGSRPRSIHEVSDPVSVFAFADAVHQDSAAPNARFYEPHEVAYRKAGRIAGAGHYRHANTTANVGWLDGHASTIQPPPGETVWTTIGNAPVVNLDTRDGPGSAYGFATWTTN